jgi:hypothetical protein
MQQSQARVEDVRPVPAPTAQSVESAGCVGTALLRGQGLVGPGAPSAPSQGRRVVATSSRSRRSGKRGEMVIQ